MTHGILLVKNQTLKEEKMFSKNEVMRFQHQSVELLKHIEESRNLAATLMKTKHYQQLGHDGIFAVIQKAKSLNINPIEALNGGLYCVQGRVEMSAQLMNQLIRSKGHSIQKDPQSNKEMCFLHGKRADNGDVWSVSFGIEDAQRAGIYRQNSPWTKFPEAMCFARALSMLARQLFPDVIQGCYVEGEIRDVLEKEPDQEMPNLIVNPTITQEQVQLLQKLINGDEEYKQKLFNFFKITNFSELPVAQWDRILAAVKRHADTQYQPQVVGA
jgi:hypothetical protein